VTDNAQSLRVVADRAGPKHQAGTQKDFNIDVNFERAKDLLEENDGAGNTFKATAKRSDWNAVVGDHHDLLHHHGAHQGAHEKRKQSFTSARAFMLGLIPAAP